MAERERTGRLTRALSAAREMEVTKLQEACESKKEEIEDLLSTDLTNLSITTNSIEENISVLTDVANKLKTAFRAFEKDSRALSTRYASDGRVAEQQETRQERSHLQKDIKEHVVSINSLLQNLGADRLSSIDTFSISSTCFSGFDANRKVPTTTTQTSNELPLSESNVLGAVGFNVSVEDRVYKEISGVAIGEQSSPTLEATKTSGPPLPQTGARPKATLAGVLPYYPPNFESTLRAGASTNLTWSGMPARKEPQISHMVDWLKSVDNQHDSETRNVGFQDDLSKRFPESVFSRRERESEPRGYSGLWEERPRRTEASAFSPHSRAFAPGAPNVNSGESFLGSSGAYHRSTPDHSLFQSMSAHLLQQDMVRKSIDPFDGTATNY